ncbi:hypothetical protein [Methanobacterium alcaliphilum]|uniref:hypothetical protein n=1 Tax=Methanobacterium alcaliphilum TaxID=392018 RepID=UPI00200AD72A|nr:hypothetical protein [Methanobacterium alcaliphilum]MCK9150832.1 hypothetical protein [Methanobacterium alcaliphilum]
MINMKSVMINDNIDPKRKVILGLYWTNKKTAVREGCDSFMIKKITTPHTIYLSDDKRRLKLSYHIMKDLLTCVENQEAVEFEIRIGKEDIKTSIHKDFFYISTSRSKELEDEIIEKMELESKKKFPNICSKFYRRLGVT